VKYMLLIYTPPLAGPDDEPCTPVLVEDWVAFDKAVSGAGIGVSSASMQDFTTATTVRVTGSGECTVTDGPFAETREILGGVYVIDVPDLDVALAWAARCPGSRGGGTVEVRPVAER
jgi:hypothetical protein